MSKNDEVVADMVDGLKRQADLLAIKMETLRESCPPVDIFVRTAEQREHILRQLKNLGQTNADDNP